ncbi:MAG: IclR family transcriptional regulator [Solirubrobacteraceae bacterium]
MDRGASLDALIGDGAGSPSNRSVDRACRLLSAFSLDEPSLTLSELARRAELPKATAHRLAVTLRACGLLTQAADGRYALGIRLLELGSIVRENLDALQLCRSAIDAVAAASGETVLLSVVDWPTRQAMLVARRDSPHPLAVGSPVGLRQQIPPGGALGKAFLAGLPPHEVEGVVNELTLVATTPKTPIERRLLLRQVSLAREAGYAFEQDEYLEGVSGVAVAVVFDGDRPLAALGVVGPTSRLAGQIQSLGALLLRETAGLRPGRLSETARSSA